MGWPSMEGTWFCFPTIFISATADLEGDPVGVGAVVVLATVYALCVGWVYMETGSWLIILSLVHTGNTL